MINEININIPPELVNNYDEIKLSAGKSIGIKTSDINDVRILRRSIDARGRKISYQLKVAVYSGNDFPEKSIKTFDFKNVANATPVIIVGAGPAGLFAALKLIQNGLKPIILERGKDIHQRKLDIAQLNRSNIVNEDSNYCFGEGGAGTFSDGKLFTRSTKRGNVNEILELLVMHGASKDILVDAHPHIGTDKLSTIMENIRNTITSHGGEYLFNTKVCDFIIKNNIIDKVIDQNGNSFSGKAVILATGHSANDIYEFLNDKKIKIEAKDFALGVRVEHYQKLIDDVQYHGLREKYNLPPATYSLVTQVDGKGVFSFCMCPGGIIVPAMTNKGELVVNGMSNSSRSGKFANSGIVVSVDGNDTVEFSKFGALQNLRFRQDLESRFFDHRGNTLQAPAQRMTDFTKNIISTELRKSSYVPGLISAPIQIMLPNFISNRLKRAFVDFDKKLRGFYTGDALLIGLESRTSSPVRIVRDRETFQHVEIKNLYPCGEGAGYAGGIVSSAIDGVSVAEKVTGMGDV
ncbi:NAD(P)/FAD-dependent oxidoreductase [Bacteroidales bacterium OttesenSCG-928-K03]|nr:NAD(P)/FAD-dependent oxidoreductase [Odoribacter sp. OttesenSCG-928-L07]MDL2242696.1 NAD(P)/FAD-dependent oxidoreductase [Bacteroidales bacterium OttesenSCG-928-K03]